jgi:hypothetical protein
MIDAVRLALAELGEVPNEELAAHVKKAYSLTVRPNFIPVLRAAVRDKENLEAWRRRAQQTDQGQGPVVTPREAAA